MFFSNRASISPSDKPICSSSPSSFSFTTNATGASRHNNISSTTNKKSKLTHRIYQRIFSRNKNNKKNNNCIVHSDIESTTTTPCLSASTSASSFSDDFSGFSISKKMSSETQSSKSSEFEALIVDHPSRTVRVSLTPVCAA